MKVPEPRKLPSGNWFIQLRLGGESVSVTNVDKKKCIKEATAIKAAYLAGKRIPKKAEPEKLPTLGEIIDHYISGRSNILSPSTIRGYKAIRRTRFQGIMETSLSDMTDSAWRSACNREAATCSAKTLTNAWRFIKTAVKEQCGMVLPEVALPQVVPNEHAFLDAEQIQRFLSAARGDKYEVVALLALSSLRRSEILGLTWENVDFEKRCLYIRGAVVDSGDGFVRKPENKNRSSTRTVPILIGRLYEVLSAERQSSGPVVTCMATAMLRTANRICDKAGVPRVGIHGLRHSFASLAYHLKVPEQVTMEIGGWSDMQTMRKIYTHIARQDMERYQAQFGAFFENTEAKNANKNANEK